VTTAKIGRLLPFAAALSFAVAVHAEDWLPIPPEQLQMTSEPLAPKAQAIYLYRQVDRDDTARVENVYVRLKILTDEGRSRANVSLTYDSNREGIGEIRARTVRPDGSVANFDGTIYERATVEARDVRVMSKTFTLPEVEAGSIIEYRFKHRFGSGFVFDSHWILSADLYTKSAQFSLIPYRGYTLRTSTPAGLPAGTQQPKLDHGIFRLAVHDIPAFVSEEYMPPAEELQMRVDFVYLSDAVADKDPASFWKRKGQESFRSVERYLDMRRVMQDAVAQTVSSGDSPEEKLRKLYARCHEIRNLSFERARSAQEVEREGSADNHDVADVWKNGYGSRHQITWLFVAMARAAGIEADPVLVATRSKYFFNPKFENPAQLSSALALVKLNGEEKLLDPGTPFAPFGAMPWAMTGVKGLRLDKDGGTWIETALPSPADSRIERKATLKLAPDGSLSGSVTITFNGLQALSRRLDMRNEDDTARVRYLEEGIKTDIGSGCLATLGNTPDWISASPTLIAQFDVKVPGWATIAGQRAFVPSGVFVGGAKRAFQHTTRIHPVYFHYPSRIEDDIQIELPAGYQITSLPKPFRANIKVADYESSAQNTGSVLHLRREISVMTLMIAPEYYGLLQDFFESVRTADTEQTVLSAPAASAALK
jgi:Domain of Unknown Function with PDB structure (DUF3857)/Transglutaminase-like superfamily